jgi:hypothetical protein
MKCAGCTYVCACMRECMLACVHAGVPTGAPAHGGSTVCMQACPQGRQLICLPAACQLTYEDAGDAADSDPLLRVIQQVPESFWGLRLAMKVLQQRALGDSSPFAVYMRHLPAAVQGLPMFFPRTLLSQHCLSQHCSRTRTSPFSLKALLPAPFLPLHAFAALPCQRQCRGLGESAGLCKNRAVTMHTLCCARAACTLLAARGGWKCRYAEGAIPVHRVEIGFHTAHPARDTQNHQACSCGSAAEVKLWQCSCSEAVAVQR